MLRDALDFVRRNYLTETVIKHPDRAEATRVANFPYAAIEEALANAIDHRSYEEREPVEVRNRVVVSAGTQNQPRAGTLDNSKPAILR
jgi:predicted HTH transcriptional regulator